VRERHRRVEEEVGHRRHERDVRGRVGHAEVRHHDAQTWMAREHRGDAARSVVGVAAPRHRADVHEHEALALGDDREYRIEARIVERELLDVFVHLEADAAVVERRAQIAGRIRVAEVHRRERQSVPAEIARGRREPRVEVARHPGLVRVGAEHEPLDAGRPQRGGHGGGLGRVIEHPRAAFGEPASNCREQARRVQVDVDVDHRR